MRNNLISFIIVFMVAFLAQGCSKKDANIETEKKEDALVRVEATRPTIQKVAHIIRAVGSFLPDEQVSISPEVEGKIAKLLVDEGDMVKRGQLLAIIDDERYRLEVEKRKAQVGEAKANLKNMKLILARKERLVKEKVISQQEYDDTFTKFLLAKAQLKYAKAALNLAKKNLKDTKIYTPMDGIITERLISLGEYVGSTQMMGAGNILFEMVNINPLKLSFTVPERYRSYLTIGKEVKLKVKAYPNEVFKGKIYFINPQIDPKTRSVEIKAYVKNDDMRLKPGFFADVTLIKDINERAIILPQDAVLYKGGKAMVYVLENNIAYKQEVKIGEQFRGKIEIISGISENSLIATKGNYLLEEGTKVEIIKASGLASGS